MRKFRRYTLIAVIICFNLFTGESYAVNKFKTIVVFFSLNANLPSYQNFLEGFHSTVSQGADEPYNLLIEYLDYGRASDDAYVKHMVGQYNEKLKDYHIDLLIAFGPMTYSILAKYGLEALKNTPTIDIELDPTIEKPPVTLLNNSSIEIKLKLNVSETFKHAFDLFPDRKEVDIISGSSVTDAYFTSLIKLNIKGFQKTHHFNFINNITLDSILQIARKIHPNAVVFIPIFLSDKKNIPFSTPEAIRIIAENCNAPVFPIFDSFTRTKGGIGGYVFSFIYIGKEAGRITREFLQGKRLQDIPIDKASFYQHIYDWQQLNKWKLQDSKAIPSDSIFLNKDVNFFHEYRWQILFILFVLITETSLVVYLYRLNRRQKEIVKQKIENENLYRELTRADRLSTMVEMTASLSHELNQPLTAVLYSAQAGKRFLESDNLDQKSAHEIFDNIVEDSKRAAGIISSVKSLMKLETREEEVVNINALIQETVNIFHTDAITKKIQTRVILLSDPVFVYGDKIQVQQVILNLITNAAAAMEKTDIEHKIIEITQRLDKDFVVVSVRDTGPGIDESIRVNLFKPFVTTRASGFGIGLAVSRSIVEKHKGTIWADNIPGGGAEFSFSLQVFKDE
jgi:signal transduction histidine kinase